MKIILNRQAKKMSNDLTNQLRIVLKQHGIKIKESAFSQFNYKCYISLGGKKDKFNLDK